MKRDEYIKKLEELYTMALEQKDVLFSLEILERIRQVDQRL